MKKGEQAGELAALQKKVREQALQLKEARDAAREAVRQTGLALDAILAEVAVRFGEMKPDGEQKSWQIEIPVPKAERYRVEATRDKSEEHYRIAVTERPPQGDVRQKR